MFRRLRRRVLTPSTAATKLSVRGFHDKDPAARELLEAVGQAFLTGYGHAVESRSAAEAGAALAAVSPRFRGFAHEGAGMGYAMLDGMPFGHSHHVADFLAGPARRQIYIAYVGVGWALARLPRFRWPAATSGAGDNLLRWLVLDGYGFHQAYFHTAKYVHQQYAEPDFPWPGPESRSYAQRVVDQGIGRAIWFVAGADPGLAATLIGRFGESRQSDLYSGVGLAATYAGGADEPELHALRAHAGPHVLALAQGSAFAAEARSYADIVLPQTELASQVYCGMTAAEAGAVTRRARLNLEADGQVPAYEVWRRRIAEEIGARSRSARRPGSQ